ncbi:MAG: hypothetical protein LBE98_01550 [Puniceicoccales bacterium]|jgi:hypothetical protein|nr:hypothetical protein [Puniceicoccales bacterium]
MTDTINAINETNMTGALNQVTGLSLGETITCLWNDNIIPYLNETSTFKGGLKEVVDRGATTIGEVVQQAGRLVIPLTKLLARTTWSAASAHPL